MMKTKRGRKQRSIRTRILFMGLSLILIIFLVIMVAFNRLANQYIQNSVEEQLQSVMLFDPPEERRPQGIPAPPGPAFNIRFPRDPIGRGQSMVLSKDYDLLFPDQTVFFPQNNEEILALADQLKSDLRDLEDSEITRLRVLGREFYYVSVPLPSGPALEPSFLIYYIDMTSLALFSSRINQVLFLVMVMAGLLATIFAVYISGKIAQPVKSLTDFAKQMGQGDFKRSTLDYGDLELLELAQSMNRAAEQLEAYDCEQRAFFQNASHELRTPLQAIKGHAEGIVHSIFDAKDASEVIINETDRLGELVEDLLYLSRINAAVPARMEEWDLREILSNCAERQRVIARERGLAFAFNFPEEPVFMMCDEKRLSKAFSNLIANSIRYATHTIILGCEKNEGGGMTITVRDDGLGIPEDDLPRIFDRFFKGRGGDHGIGLSLVRAIVEQHGGTVSGENQPEQGAIFTVLFPNEAI